MDEQQLVNPTVPLLHHKLAYGHPRPSGDIQVLLALNDPASRRQLLVDLFARSGLTGDVRIVGAGHGLKATGLGGRGQLAGLRAACRC